MKFRAMQMIVPYVQTKAWFGLWTVGVRFASFKWLSVLVLALGWKCALTFISEPDDRKGYPSLKEIYKLLPEDSDEILKSGFLLINI